MFRNTQYCINGEYLMEINTKTIKFIGVLNMLAEMSKNGIHPFSTATAADKDSLLYDDKNPVEIGEPWIIGDKEFPSDSSYPLIADSLIDTEHHDIISTWTEIYALECFEIVAQVGGEGDPHIVVTSGKDEDLYIVIEDGFWYNAM